MFTIVSEAHAVMEALCTSETSVTFYQTRRPENLKSQRAEQDLTAVPRLRELVFVGQATNDYRLGLRTLLSFSVCLEGGGEIKRSFVVYSMICRNAVNDNYRHHNASGISYFY